MKSKKGFIARITKKQEHRDYFSSLPVGTKFIIIDEHIDMPAYDLTGYFLYCPPHVLSPNRYHHTGYIEKGTWEILGNPIENPELLK